MPFASFTWWRHQMETFSALLAIWARNSPVTGEFPAQRPVTRSFDVFFDLRLNERLSKQTWGWWFETPTRPSWRHGNHSSVVVPHRDLHTVSLCFVLLCLFYQLLINSCDLYIHILQLWFISIKASKAGFKGYKISINTIKYIQKCETCADFLGYIANQKLWVNFSVMVPIILKYIWHSTTDTIEREHVFV